MKGYPKWFNARFISFIMGALTISGLILVPGVLETKLEMNVPAKLSGSMRLYGSALHTLISYLSFVLFGSLWSIHMRREWRRHKNIYSGSLLFFFFIVLSLSSIGILYFGNEKLSWYSSVLHTFFGITLPLIYAGHIIKVKNLNK
jgi:hypothetical protein